MKISEIFLSIQGEGLLTGLPTVFVRTAGCNLRCSYCDTKYAYAQGKNLSIKQIVKQIEKFYIKRVCLTGGEPLLQEEIDQLVRVLVNKNYAISIETNGSINLKRITHRNKVLFSLDIKCPSSGSCQSMDFSNLKLVKKTDQVKFIIGNNRDFAFACDVVNKYRLLSKVNVFFHPVGGVNAKKLVKNILSKKMDVRVGLQIHKIIWGEKKRGV